MENLQDNNFANLTEEELNFLAVYLTWPNEPIEYDVIDTLLTGSNDIIQSLLDKNILSYGDDEMFRLDNNIADSLRKQIDFKTADFSEYIWNIKKNVVYNTVNQNYTQNYSPYIASSLITYRICEDVELFQAFLNALYNNHDQILNNFPEPDYSNLLKTLEQKADPTQLADLYNAEARVEVFRKNPTAAKPLYLKAIEITDTLGETDEILSSKSTLLNNLGYLEEEIDELESAYQHYQEAVEIDKKLSETEDNLSNLADHLGNLAVFENRLGNAEACKNRIIETLEIRRKLPEQPKNLNDMVDMLYGLSMIESNLGDIQSAKSHKEEALTIERKINEKVPDWPQNLQNMARELNSLAMIENKLGNLDSARSYLEEQMNLRKEKFPQSPNFMEGLINTLYGLGIIENRLGDNASAKNHWEEALEIAKEIENEEWIKDIEGMLSE
ncbi:MAG: tetratricopeptide repeat protein [Spirochaetales bacterium]|nr:tetratricopeptide repeat protein [Spirochaetales bacterium]